jgi:hypothetical protein
MTECPGFISVDPPPKINEPPPKLVEVEVMPPEKPAAHEHAGSYEGAPIHALSALVMLAVDSLWAFFEWAPPLWFIAVPFCFVTTLIPTFLIQQHLKKDSKGRAAAFATLLAVLAALPFPIASTPVGLGLLAWTGLGKLFGKPVPK